MPNSSDEIQTDTLIKLPAFFKFWPQSRITVRVGAAFCGGSLRAETEIRSLTERHCGPQHVGA